MRIVLCDQHALFAQAFSSLLQARGHDVLACPGTVKEALVLLSQEADAGNSPDVVVMDLVLPDAQGPEAVRVVRQVAPETPIAVLTGTTDVAALEAVLAAGADGAVIKTESVDEVERLLMAITSPTFARLRVGPKPEKALSRRARALSRNGARRRDEQLPTSRELEVIRLLAAGATTEEIAGVMKVRTATVRTHLRHLFVKLGVHSRLQLIAVAVRDGLIDQSAAGASSAPGLR